MIRDTSAQDKPIAPQRHRRAKRFAAIGLVVVALGAAGGALVANWHAGTPVVNAARLRIAEVTRGTLVRDASVNGRVVAAVSPTLYSRRPPATVTLKVNAGDTVKKGDVLAVLESPDLADALKREQSSYEQLRGRGRAPADPRRASRSCWPSATPTPPRSSACRPSARWSASSSVGIERRHRQDRLTRRPRTRCKSAQIRASHAGQAADAGKRRRRAAAEDARSASCERQRLSLANAQRRVDELTVRAPVDGFIGSLSVARPQRGAGQRAADDAGRPVASSRSSSRSRRPTWPTSASA